MQRGKREKPKKKKVSKAARGGQRRRDGEKELET